MRMKYVAGLFILLSSYLMADDIDIFTASSSSQGQTLFLLDNSESMFIEKTQDASGMKRIDALTKAFNQFIWNSESMRVGLAQLNFEGAAIIQPVVDIDTPYNPIFYPSIAYGTDNLFQNLNTGEVKDHSNYDQGNFGRINGANYSETITINDETDIMMIDPSNGTLINKQDITLHHKVLVAVRFKTPAGSKLADNTYEMLDTYFTAEAGKSDKGAFRTKIRFSDVNSSFTDAAEVLNRYQNHLVSGDCGWINKSWTDAGDNGSRLVEPEWHEGTSYQGDAFVKIGPAGISSVDNCTVPLLNASRHNSNYTAGDYVVAFFMQDNSVPYTAQRRIVRHKNSDPSTHNKFNMEMIFSPGVSGDPILNAFRFDNLQIPQGSTIHKASLLLSRDGGTPIHANILDADLKVSIEQASHSLPLTLGNNTLTSRVKSAWKPSQFANYSNSKNFVVPGFASLLQQVVNQADWCGGNAATLFTQLASVSDPEYVKLELSRNNSAGYTETLPRLQVEYTENPDGCVNDYLEHHLRSDASDAVERSDGSVDVNTAIVLKQNELAAFRFKSVPVLANANILRAYLEVTTTDDWGRLNSDHLRIVAEKSSQSKLLKSERNNLSSRVKTTLFVDWSSPEKSCYSLNLETKSTQCRSPNIAHLINEVIASAGIDPNNNALTFFIKDITGSAAGSKIESYDHKPANSVRLVLHLKKGGLTGDAYIYRKKLDEMVKNLGPVLKTPLSDALFETVQYWGGGTVVKGASRSSPGLAELDHSQLSAIESYTPSVLPGPLNHCHEVTGWRDYECHNQSISTPVTYQSPYLASGCDSNHLVLMTDGAPSGNSSTIINDIHHIVGRDLGYHCGSKPYDDQEKCARSLVQWANQKTLYQLKTHTIAFNLIESTHEGSKAKAFLQDLAHKGNGGYYEADSTEELLAAFHSTQVASLSDSVSFGKPALTINQTNRGEHDGYLYFPLFKPSNQAYWLGNIKKYRLKTDTTPAEIFGQTGGAVDPSTGFFKNTASEYWSRVIDGDDVEKGGAASRLAAYDSRTLLTDYQTLASSTSYSRLKDIVNNVGGNKLTPLLSDLASAGEVITETELTDVLRWLMGKDNLNAPYGDALKARRQIGSVIHSNPTVIDYFDGHRRLFFGTNEGFLHSIDPDDGKEAFAFIPQELLKQNAVRLHRNGALTSDGDRLNYVYGLDGPITTWVNNRDFKKPEIKKSQGDHAYLYTGMRRGGRNYYGLDVTKKNKAEPISGWSNIVGGHTGFEDLGQTWSTLVKTKVILNGAVRDVLVFGGGFDESLDKGVALATMGNAIYMVDAVSGQLLWSVTDTDLPAMKYSVPADLSVIDLNQDGMMDLFFAADTGGQVWRFDVNHQNSGQTDPNFIKGHLVADLSGSSSDSDIKRRKFFNKPDVGLISRNGKIQLTVSIGSGALNKPLQTDINNRFYVLFQSKAPLASTVSPIKDADLSDLTSNEAGAVDANLVNPNGWFIDLEAPGLGLAKGEKVLAASNTSNNVVYFTTYQPGGDSSGACSAPTYGQSKLYAMSIFNAQAVINLDQDLTNVERSKELNNKTIPGGMVDILKEDQLHGLIGPELPTKPQQNGFEAGYHAAD